MKKTILALSIALMIGAVSCETKGSQSPEPATTDSTQVVTDSASVEKDSSNVKLDSTEKK